MGLALGHHIPGIAGFPTFDPCSMTVNFDGPNPGIAIRFRYDIRFRPDGLRVWTRHGGTIGPTTGNLFQYDLPSPWALSGWFNQTSVEVGTDSLVRTIDWHDNGTKISMLNRWFSGFRRLDTWDQSATPYDISSGLGAVIASRTGLQGGGEYLVRFSLDEAHVFITRSGNQLNKMVLTTPNDISTMILAPVQQFITTPFNVAVNNIGFNHEHTRIYGLTPGGGSGGLLCSWELTAPDDISAPFNFTTGVNINALPEGSNHLGIARGLTIVPSTGTLILFGDQNNYRVRSWGGVLGVSQDPNFSDVVLLLDFSGADGAQAITDLSNSAHTETFFDNAQVDLGRRFLGQNTLLLDGTDDEVTYPTSTDWAFGTGDFTIEFGLQLDDVFTMTLLSIFDTTIGWFIQSLQSGGQKFVLGHGASTLINVSWTPPTALNVLEHIAVTRQGTTLSVWQNGALLASVTDSTNFVQGTKALRLGSLDGLTEFTEGSIGGVRITKGLARYTAPFTPPVCFYPSAGP